MTATRPDIGSPVLDGNGREYLLLCLEGKYYSWIDATVENGDIFDYKRNLHGKGNQLLPDSLDFPHFAKYGLHSDRELSQTLSITGKSVARITVDGRPWASSGVGFLADDETIMSVIWGDNRIVRKMGLTHPDIARPLFHLVNGSGMMAKMDAGFELSHMIYNNREISFDITGSRGWQESIFNDEILGSGHIHIWGSLSPDDETFLADKYKDLEEAELDSLKSMLTHIHTGNMVLYYITRYGFYEGRNEYKPDPLVVAYMFGLRTLGEIHEYSGGDLFAYLNTPHTENPPYKGRRQKAEGRSKNQVASLKIQGALNEQQNDDKKSPSPGSEADEGEGLGVRQIDSLMKVLKSAGRHWNDPAGRLIKIGDPAVPALVDLLFDNSESQWNRRVAAMTLNQMHSPLTLEPGLKLLYDTTQEWDLRNQIIPSILGFDIPGEKDRLWELFNDPDASRYRGNIAGLLVYADTSKAYMAYRELFKENDGYMKMQSMRHLASLRPDEATFWYLQGVREDDWWTANVAMDSIISLESPDARKLEDIFYTSEDDEIRWRICNIISHTDLPTRDEFLDKAAEDESWLVRMEAKLGLKAQGTGQK